MMPVPRPHPGALLLALLLALPPAVVSAQSDDDVLRAHFLAARAAQDRGSLDVAVREYLAVLHLQPALPEALANLGIVYHLQSRYDDSARTLEKALALRPTLRGSSLFLGIDYVKLNQSRRAIAPLQRAVAQEPDNKDAVTWLSGALWSAGERAAAVEQLERASQRFPSDADVLFLLAEAYRKSARLELDRVANEGLGTNVYHRMFGDSYAERQSWDKALRHYERAGAHYELGVAYRRQGKLDAARDEFALELATNANAQSARAALAELSILQGHVREGLSALEAAIRVAPRASAAALGLPPAAALLRGADPGDEQLCQLSRDALPKLQMESDVAASHLALAAFYARLGDARWSVEFTRFESSVPPAPPNGDLLTRARRAFDRADFAASVKLLRAALASGPRQLEARYLLGRAWQQLALTTLQRMVAAAPDSYRVHQLLAQSWEEREEREHALAEYAIVAQKNPDLGGLHFSIGEVLWSMGRAAEALAEFEEELRRNPLHAEAHAGAGAILTSQHEPERAIPHLEEALRLEPALSSAREELGKALYQQKLYAQAERELKLALANDREGTAHYTLGMVYRDAGRAAEARATFAEARRIKAERLADARYKSVEEPEK